MNKITGNFFALTLILSAGTASASGFTTSYNIKNDICTGASSNPPGQYGNGLFMYSNPPFTTSGSIPYNGIVKVAMHNISYNNAVLKPGDVVGTCKNWANGGQYGGVNQVCTFKMPNPVVQGNSFNVSQLLKTCTSSSI